MQRPYHFRNSFFQFSTRDTGQTIKAFPILLVSSTSTRINIRTLSSGWRMAIVLGLD